MQQNVSLLTERQTAAALACSPRHLVNLRNQGKIPFLKLGTKLVRYQPEAVAAALSKMTGTTT